LALPDDDDTADDRSYLGRYRMTRSAGHTIHSTQTQYTLMTCHTWVDI